MVKHGPFNRRNSIARSNMPPPYIARNWRTVYKGWATRSSTARAVNRKSRGIAMSISKLPVHAGKQIKEHLAMENQSGAAAAQIAAHHTREAKIGLSHEEMQQRHKDMATEFGDQPDHVKAEAEGRARDVGQDTGKKIAHSAVTFAKERNFERDAVADGRALLTDALRRSMGGATLAQVKANFEERIESGEFVEVQRQGNSPDRRLRPLR